MSNINRLLRRTFILLFVFFISSPLLANTLDCTNANNCSGGTNINFGLVYKPTSLSIEPVTATANEGGGNVIFKAIAHFDYPNAPSPIPDKDVSSDPNTFWSVDKPAIAIINSIGVATPVSDLNLGSATAKITASYTGLTAHADFIVKGIIVSPPIDNGGGGGGGSSGGYNPPSDGGNNEPDKSSENDAGDNGSENNGGTDSGATGDNDSGNNGGINTGSTGDNSSGNNGGINTGSTGDNGTSRGSSQPSSSNSGILPLDRPYKIDEIKPLDEVFKEEKIKVKDPTITTRQYVAYLVVNRLKILERRKELLDRCYADLENCTNIFRMFSSFDGIKLDPKNLVLFPDLEGNPLKNDIQNLALLSVIQGYYGIENSPFLPEKEITRAETLKILTTVLSNFEKGSSDFKYERFDYNTLFYKEIYAASLVAQALELQNSDVFVMNFLIKKAFALSSEEENLIKKQKTVFKDVRPDLYDAHWYYPIVYNKICELKILACIEGSEAKPDQSPNLQEVDLLVDAFEDYINAHQLETSILADDDGDSILNIDENQIYFTNPKHADTDGDGLLDGDEIFKYKTNPNYVDTDGDGLSDGDEINIYGTNPLLMDTDGDGFSDSEELRAGSNPLDAKSMPDDKNGNKIIDSWEIKYNIEVKDGMQDTDGDGLSDALEYLYGTDPTRIDTDGDGYTDAEEVLELNSNPLDKNSPGEMNDDFPVVINNFQYGQIIADNSPLIKGVGAPSLGNNIVKIQILLRNDFGSEMILGTTETDARGRFVFIPDIEIKDGTYMLLARSINKGQVKLSSPIKVVIDTTIAFESAKVKKLESTDIPEDILIKNLVLKVDSKDGQPVLYGTLTDLGSRVNVTWQSLVVSSALIADSTDGVFSIKSPLLEEGSHTVYIQTIRKKDNVMGKTIKINFNLTVNKGDQGNVLGASLNKTSDGWLHNVSNFVTKQSWPFWVGIVVILTVIGGAVYIFVLKDIDRSDQSK